MIILAYITFTLLLSLPIVIYGLNSYWRIYQEEVYLNRFVVVKTALDIYPAEEEEGEYSEDIRKLISGAGVSKDSNKIKRATTQTVIDLEEILIMQEWTSSKFEDQEVKNDCVMITFRSGDQILVLEPLGTMEKVLVAYQSLKSLEGLIR
tara:strand:+ start:2026 stop:2475 length:450 start_codon:yes stop_codon:yes gene_type:complete